MKTYPAKRKVFYDESRKYLIFENVRKIEIVNLVNKLNRSIETIPDPKTVKIKKAYNEMKNMFSGIYKFVMSVVSVFKG